MSDNFGLPISFAVRIPVIIEFTSLTTIRPDDHVRQAMFGSQSLIKGYLEYVENILYNCFNYLAHLFFQVVSSQYNF